MHIFQMVVISLSFQDAETVGIMCSWWQIHLFFKAKQWSMWTTWFCHWKCSVPVKVGDQDQYDEWIWAPSGRISREDKLSPPSCLLDGNFFSLSHLWWPTLCLPQRLSDQSQTTPGKHLVNTSSVSSSESFLCLFVPLITFSGWVKSLLLWAQEQRMDCEHPRRTFYFIFILFCDDFIIPLCLSFSQNCYFFSPFSFFSIVFFGLPIYWVQLHGSDLMPGLGLCSSEQQRTPRLLDFIDSVNPLPSLWENGLAECWCLFIFSKKGC